MTTPLPTVRENIEVLSQAQPLYVNRASPRTAYVKPMQCAPACSPKKCAPVKKCVDPCGNNYDMGYGMGWGWLGALVLWFIIFLVLFWLIFYSLKPSFVLQSGTNQVDTAKVLLAAVIAALILIIIVWLIRAAVTRLWY